MDINRPYLIRFWAVNYFFYYQVINLCEMKFSINPFVIDKRYAEELRNKIGVFKTATKTQKAIFLTLITTFGLHQNSHSSGLVQNDLTMNVLF